MPWAPVPYLLLCRELREAAAALADAAEPEPAAALAAAEAP